MNRITKQACAVMNDVKLPVKSVREFWRKMGREDLVNVRHHHLPCAYQEAVNIAHKIVARRKRLDEGTIEPERPKPLTRYITTRQVGKVLYYHFHFLRPRKGWQVAPISYAAAMRERRAGTQIRGFKEKA